MNNFNKNLPYNQSQPIVPRDERFEKGARFFVFKNVECQYGDLY